MAADTSQICEISDAELSVMQATAFDFAASHDLPVDIEELRPLIEPARADGLQTDASRCAYVKQGTTHMMGMFPDTIVASGVCDAELAIMRATASGFEDLRTLTQPSHSDRPDQQRAGYMRTRGVTHWMIMDADNGQDTRIG